MKPTPARASTGRGEPRWLVGESAGESDEGAGDLDAADGRAAGGLRRRRPECRPGHRHRVALARRPQAAGCHCRPCWPHVPLEEGTDLATAVSCEGSGCYVLAILRRSCRERRGSRSRRNKKTNAAAAAPPPEKTILKRLLPTDLASLAASPSARMMFGAWDYQALLRELQLYFSLAAPKLEDSPLWSPWPSASPAPSARRLPRPWASRPFTGACGGGGGAGSQRGWRREISVVPASATDACEIPVGRAAAH
uniref:Uncharacterized protein n=1 Tax=Arundo donax TaxID=35708 RepID=A0A0A9DP57_ARUDO